MALTKVSTHVIADDLALPGNPTTTTQSTGNDTTRIATTAFVQTELSSLVDSAPSTLNTLNELAAALGDDANFSTTVTNSIAAKLPLAGGTLTGNLAHASDFTIDVGGDIVLDAAGQQIIFATAGTNVGQIDMQGTDLEIKSLVNNADLFIRGTDGGSEITALTFDMSEAGAATFNAGGSFGGAVQLNDGQLNVHSSSASAIIGSIGNTANDLNIFSTSSGHNGLRFHVNGILPTDNSGTIVDNDADLGDPSYRFKDLYLGGGITAAGNITVTSATATTNGMVRLQNNMDNNYEALRIESLGDYDAHIGFFADGSANYYWGMGVDYSDSGKFKIANDNLLATNTRFTIDTSGNVGIGETSPAKLGLTGSSAGKVLHLSGDDCQVRLANTVLHHDNSGNTTTHLRNHYGATSDLARMKLESGYISFCTGTSYDEKMRLKGNTLYVSTDIGSHSGGSVNGNSFAHNTYAHAAVFGANSTPDGTVVIEDYDVSSGIGNTVLKCYLRDQDPATSATFINFGDGGGSVGSITHKDDGSGVNYNTSSDYRLKENINYTWDATTLVKQLKPAKFNFIKKPGKTVQGFLAHEVSDVVPGSVRGEKDHMMEIGTIKDSDDNIIYEGVYEHFCKTDEGQTWVQTGTEPLYQELDYSKLVPVLTKAIQEQQTVIEDLKSRIETLEG